MKFAKNLHTKNLSTFAVRLGRSQDPYQPISVISTQGNPQNWWWRNVFELSRIVYSPTREPLWLPEMVIMRTGIIASPGREDPDRQEKKDGTQPQREGSYYGVAKEVSSKILPKFLVSGLRILPTAPQTTKQSSSSGSSACTVRSLSAIANRHASRFSTNRWKVTMVSFPPIVSS
ncbi:uncharacterized protein BJX67DRAFT_365856 [Aspergillus lucknowensis]|uniref:Uncharacterized protein n=1 Tax=Aspergillus lucknowensis TaxID=176173 RepID=A0ABR4LDV2_9EURO